MIPAENKMAFFAVCMEGEAMLSRDFAWLSSARRSLALHRICHFIFPDSIHPVFLTADHKI
jgi:hypothetical protein